MKHLLIGYFFCNMCTKNYHSRFVYFEDKGGCFGDTV